MFVEDLTPGHVLTFMGRPIRVADEQEWLDHAGKRPKDMTAIILASLSNATLARAVVRDDGCPMALFGCDVDDGVGTLWLIGAADAFAPAIHKAFIRGEFAKIVSLAPVLQAYPSSKNTQHHIWLEHLGFTRGPQTFTYANPEVPFFRYTLRR